jgi:Membrane-bound serine protease (ClpP class)
MRLKRFYNLIVSNNKSVLFLILLYVAAQFLFIPEYTWLELVGVAALHIGVALSLLYINQLFIIIKTKTFLLASFYLLFVITQPSFYGEIYPALSALCILFASFILFFTYQNPQSQWAYFISGLILGIGSLWFPPFLFFIPLLWRGGYRFQSLNTRSLIATLLGAGFVCLGIFTYSVYKNDLSLFPSFFSSWESLLSIQIHLSLQEILSIGILLLLFIIASINLYLPGRGERIKTLHYLSYFFILGLISMIGYFIQSQWNESWLAIFFLGASFMLTHLFSKHYSRLGLFSLLFIILILISTFILTLFFPEMNNTNVFVFTN